MASPPRANNLGGGGIYDEHSLGMHGPSALYTGHQVQELDANDLWSAQIPELNPYGHQYSCPTDLEVPASSTVLAPMDPTELPLLPDSHGQPRGWAPSTPLDTTYRGFQYPEMIDPTALTMTTVQDPIALWGAPSVRNPWSASPQAPAESHAPFEAAPLVPILPGSPPRGPHAPIAHHCAWSEPAGGEQQQQQQHNFLCAFQRANAEHPDWERVKHERKRAERRTIETRHRRKQRDGHEKIESTFERLKDLNANLVAEERALTTEKLALMEQLLTHADCNDDNVAYYLLYASKET